MKFKHIKYGLDAKYAIFKGMDRLQRATAPTMGPYGRLAVIDKPGWTPTCTNDGVTVNRETWFADHWQNLGANLLKECSSLTNDGSGDGTTTTTILAHKLVQGGIQALSEGHDLLEVLRGMQDSREKILAALQNLKKDVTTRKDILQVSSIASDSQEVAELIADALEEVGRDGVVNVEEGNSTETHLDSSFGMVLESGYALQSFVNNVTSNVCQLKNPLIFVFDDTLDSPSLAAQFLTLGLQNKRPVLFLCHNFSADVLATMSANADPRRVEHPVYSCAVKAPKFREKRTELLLDVAALTGAKPCIPARGDNPKSWGIRDLGSCDSVEVKKTTTRFLEGHGTDEEIMARIAQLRAQYDKTASGLEAEQIGQRIGFLADGVTVIKVGANTEMEMREKKRRIEDALSATRASIEEGIVPGGGAALLWAQQYLEVNRLGGYGRGVQIVSQACQAPLRTILENAGLEPNPIVYRILETGSPDMGYDVTTKAIVPVLEHGIVDPLKVVRTAFTVSMSMAETMLRVQVAITPNVWPEDEAKEL